MKSSDVVEGEKFFPICIPLVSGEQCTDVQEMYMHTNTHKQIYMDKIEECPEQGERQVYGNKSEL